MSSGSGTAGRRLGTITIDQAISSASNILITLLAARVLDIRSFGLFGIVFLVAVTSAGISRALVGEPLLVRPQESRERPGEAIGTALTLGFALAMAIAAGAAVAAPFDRNLSTALLVLAVCSPMMLLQDLGRYLAFATHRPARALGLDLAWLGLIIAAVACLIVVGAETLTWFLVAWAGTGAVAGMLLFWQYRGHRVELGIAWLRETWPFSWRYALSFGSTQGAVLAASIALAGILGADALGAIRGALLLYGPLVQLQAASIAAGVAEVSHLEDGLAEVPRHVRRSTLLTTAAAVANLAILVALPDRIGELLLGDTWPATEELLLPAGAQMVLLGLISGVRSALLGMRAVRKTLRIDIATTVITFGTTIAGAIAFGITGAFWSLACGQGVVAVIWWVVYRDHMRSGAPFEPDVTTTENVEAQEGC